MASSATYKFEHVMVSIPSQSTGGSEATFVPLSAGTLLLDGRNELSLEFAGPTHLDQKRLGCLILASAVAHDVHGRTIDVKTEGSSSGRQVQQLYRMEFPSPSEARYVRDRADAMQSREQAVWHQGDRARGGKQATLEENVKRAWKGQWPLVYQGMQLYGPDPAGDAGSEVLLGEGVTVLLDPPAGSQTIGSYEILFYCIERHDLAPTLRLPIGPRLVLKELPREQAECDDDEAPAVSFQIGTKAGLSHTVAFDNADRGAEFARDFRVRQRLMKLALASVPSQDDAPGRFSFLTTRLDWAWRRASMVLVTPILVFALAATHSSTRGPAAQACAKACALLA